MTDEAPLITLEPVAPAGNTGKIYKDTPIPPRDETKSKAKRGKNAGK